MRFHLPDAFRMTEKDREVMDRLKRSPEWAQLTQREFLERLERRRQLARASALRQADLRKRLDGTSPKCAAANERLARAEAELRAARLAHAEATQQAVAAQAHLGEEVENFHRKMHEDNDARVALIWFVAQELDEVVRHKAEVVLPRSRSWMGLEQAAYSNHDEIGRVRGELRGISDQMRALSEGAYPENLLEIFAAHTATLRKIAKKFDVTEYESDLRKIEERAAEVQTLTGAGDLLKVSAGLLPH